MAKELKKEGNSSITISGTKKGGVAVSIYDGDRAKSGEHERTTVVINPGGPSKIDYHNEDKSIKESTPITNDKGGCYLTSACMAYTATAFDDACYELTTLRQFRDSYVASNYPEDISHYYDVAPRIVEIINHLPSRTEVWIELFNTLVQPSVCLINKGELREAYELYKRISLSLEEKYLLA